MITPGTYFSYSFPCGEVHCSPGEHCPGWEYLGEKFKQSDKNAQAHWSQGPDDCWLLWGQGFTQGLENLLSYYIYCTSTMGLLKRLCCKNKQEGTEMNPFVIRQVSAANETAWLEFLIQVFFNAAVIPGSNGTAKSESGGIWKTTGRNSISPTCPVKCYRRPRDNYYRAVATAIWVCSRWQRVKPELFEQ